MSDSLPDDSFVPPLEDGDRSPSSFPSLEELASLLPQYEFHQVIGFGGMGAVYLARQPHLDRWVALKVLPVSAAANAEDADRFNTEARAMARMSHPHIVAVFEFGQTVAGHLYLAMEFVEGADLHWRTRAGEITPERARDVIAQLCEALQYAHEHGVIHRDIKPANILITPDWQVKVVDFGLARDLTVQAKPDESEYGTPDYTAPERLIAGAPVDHRADIYSLGVVIHEILTGLTPRAAGTAAGQGLPEGFAGVLSKCLMHDPARRYQSAREVRTALLAAAMATKKKAAPVAVNPPTTPPRRPMPVRPAAPPPPPVSSSPAWLGTLGWGLSCLVAMGGLGWLVWRDQYQNPAAEPSKAVSTETVVSEQIKPQKKPAQKVAEKAKTVAKPAPQKPKASVMNVGMTDATSDMSSASAAKESVVSELPKSNKAISQVPTISAAVQTVDFKRQIMPIFRAKCYECHSEAKGKEKGDVALDTEAKLKANIGPGQHVIPGQPAKSTMLISCKLPDDDDEVMPPKGKNRLTAPELTLLETWIKEGANLSGAAASAVDATQASAPVTWTSSDGKAIQASFVSMQGDQVTLKMTATGMEYTFPLSRLSPESQVQAKAAAGM